MNLVQWHIDQGESIRVADNDRLPWTAEDVAVAIDPAHTAVRAARLTGRTLAAIQNIRYRHRNPKEM